jgi:hypothetical protein
LLNSNNTEHIISKEAAHAFRDGLREREIRRQLSLGSKLTAALKQGLELVAANTAAATSLTVLK